MVAGTGLAGQTAPASRPGAAAPPGASISGANARRGLTGRGDAAHIADMADATPQSETPQSETSQSGTSGLEAGAQAAGRSGGGAWSAAGLRADRPGEGPLAGYPVEAAFDEMFARDGRARASYTALYDALAASTPDELNERQRSIEQSFLYQGITFTVYGQAQATERIIPTDVIPRIVPASEWLVLESGLKQRLDALNLFLDDLYNDQQILKDGVVPRDLVLACPNFRREMLGVRAAKGAYVNVCGTDLIRGQDGAYAVLEDNLRVPSGVSYMLANREAVKRAFPTLFRQARIRPVEQYPDALLGMLKGLASDYQPDPVVVVLTPGVFNAAYFEHAYLARLMGAPLVEGRDLVAHNNIIYMRTTSGLQRVDVIYRRIDDDFIDPVTFRRDSILGVPGLMNAYRAGNVVIANAPGCGVADDKAVYAYTPHIIRYYLGEDAILPIVETYLCREHNQLSHVLANLDTLVVKAVGESGGYGMLIGPHASAAERAAFGERVKADPSNYIAQPTIQLSTAPCLIDGRIEPRHVDLRPYIIAGDKTVVTPGALTRVALRRGSLVVNSSQGGGSKDTWVMAGDQEALA